MNMINDRARALVANSFVSDAILPWTEYGDRNLRRQTLPRYKANGFDLVSLSLGSDKEANHDIRDAIQRAKADIKSSADYRHVLDACDLERAFSNRQLGITLNVQGTEYLDGDIDNVKEFFDLGIRQSLLVYNFENRVGHGCHEDGDTGLKPFGRDLIKEMNRVGMIVDCSHTGYRTSMEAIEWSDQPVMFTHSNPRALWNHDRNIHDDQAIACAERGGLVGIAGVGIFMGDDDASSEKVFSQIDYWAELIGPQHVTMGTDYVYDHGDMQKYMRSVDVPAGGNYENMTRYFGPDQVLELTECMISAGYGDEDIKGILGANYRRVAKEVWSAAT